MRNRPRSRSTFSCFRPRGSRPVRALNAELLRILGVQSLPAAELQRVDADHAANRLTGKKSLEHVEADMPAGGSHRYESTIDVVPQCQARAAARGLELPPDVLAAPVVLEEFGCFGSRDSGLGNLR